MKRIDAAKRAHSILPWILLPLLSAGCTTMGTGYGTTAAGTPVHFHWQSSDDVSGTLYATLADGSVYTGRVGANLADPEGNHLRYKFRLEHPSNGMAGGGLGNCQSFLCKRARTLIASVSPQIAVTAR
jgi:hypothetical protein